MINERFTIKAIKTSVCLKKSGVNLARYKLYDKKWIIDSNINTVIDIGANIGEFTILYSVLFGKADIYAFEPLPDCFLELKRKTQKIPRIQIYNIGLGNEEILQEIYKSDWHPASSFLDMSSLHKENYPHSANHKKINVKIDKLDNVLKDKSLNDNILIKLDVQGFEAEVIKGGMAVFKKAKIVITEVSFVELYENEPMFDGIYLLLTSLGFEYCGSLKQSTDKRNQSYLQADCIFINNKI